MKPHITADFRTTLASLPPDIQKQAREAFRLFRANPQHPSLHFKRIRAREAAYSARVGIHYRAIAYEEAGELYWFWIGTHAEYDQIVKAI